MQQVSSRPRPHARHSSNRGIGRGSSIRRGVPGRTTHRCATCRARVRPVRRLERPADRPRRHGGPGVAVAGAAEDHRHHPARGVDDRAAAAAGAEAAAGDDDAAGHRAVAVGVRGDRRCAAATAVPASATRGPPPGCPSRIDRRAARAGASPSVSGREAEAVHAQQGDVVGGVHVDRLGRQRRPARRRSDPGVVLARDHVGVGGHQVVADHPAGALLDQPAGTAAQLHHRPARPQRGRRCSPTEGSGSGSTAAGSGMKVNASTRARAPSTWSGGTRLRAVRRMPEWRTSSRSAGRPVERLEDDRPRPPARRAPGRGRRRAPPRRPGRSARAGPPLHPAPQRRGDQEAAAPAPAPRRAPPRRAPPAAATSTRAPRAAARARGASPRSRRAPGRPDREHLLHQAAPGPEEGPEDDPQHDDRVERRSSGARGRGRGASDLVVNEMPSTSEGRGPWPTSEPMHRDDLERRGVPVLQRRARARRLAEPRGGRAGGVAALRPSSRVPARGDRARGPDAPLPRPACTRRVRGDARGRADWPTTPTPSACPTPAGRSS